MAVFANHVDFSKFEARNVAAHNNGSAPSSPVAGQIYYNTGDGNLYVWDAVGSAWVDLTVQGGSVVDASTTAKGITKLSVAPVSGTNPIAVGDNDTRLHTQNTDGGTTATLFYLVGTSANDVAIKKEATDVMAIRTGADGAYADLKAANLTLSGNLTVNGTTTSINSNTLSVGDNEIELNNDITTAAASTQNAGLFVRRYAPGDVLQGAELLWDETTDRWSHVYPASSGTGTVTKIGAVKFSGGIPGATAGTAQTITHSLNTQDIVVRARRASDNAIVEPDWIANGVNTVQVTFGAATAANDYFVTIVG